MSCARSAPLWSQLFSASKELPITPDTEPSGQTVAQSAFDPTPLVPLYSLFMLALATLQAPAAVTSSTVKPNDLSSGPKQARPHSLVLSSARRTGSPWVFPRSVVPQRRFPAHW